MTDVLLAGATGLVGQAVLDHHDPQTLTISTVGRRATGRVKNEVITDLVSPISLPPADIAICALGTTIASAGSKGAFQAVDHDAVLAFARAAQAAGVNHFIVVTAVGANPKAAVFYSRVKGETERDLEALGFSRLDIAQPGLLLGRRTERRPVESLLQTVDPVMRLFMKGPMDRYAGIPTSVVGSALLALCKKRDAGVYRHENRALHRLSVS
ncbi:oxidoreductase [Congregibacter variabilis]|uniref:Oxidoreductase n=1 Tax=Congregibacter variabilis TaxID=3081200 RepID=A0ABZ0HZZ1_9GAMM|nr:oxidoreductase [Congregibacter sp. IMCC43200]